jgi:hypothetical protein
MMVGQKSDLDNRAWLFRQLRNEGYQAMGYFSFEDVSGVLEYQIYG